MRQSTVDYMRVTYPDKDIFVQEKNVVRIEQVTGVTVTFPAGSLTPVYSATFYPIDSVITIDLSELFAIQDEGEVRVADITAPSSVYLDIDWEIAGMINPANALIPANGKSEDLTILPPSMMLQDIGVPVKFEAYGDISQDHEVKYQGLATHNYLKRENTLPAGKKWLEIVEHDAVIQRVNLRPLVCGRTYAAVKWYSSYGVERCHTFEVRDIKATVGESVQLQTNDINYKRIKGRVDSFKICLDELSVFDFWYYADVILSSDVRVSFDGATWERVDVTTGAYTLNNGDAETNKLEMEVNWRHYDAINL